MLRIFILDVDQPSIETLLGYLQEKKYREPTRVFQDPAEMLEACGEMRPGVAFIRLGSPAFNGLEAAYTLLGMDPWVKIVFLARGKKYSINAWEVGAMGILMEPFSQEKFFKLLDRAGGV